jgi:predicted AAA+ superfamily ATPase
MNYFKRHAETVLADMLKRFKCVLVSGPRQVGKSTLIMNLKEETPRKYVTLDDLELREMAKKDPKGFLAIHKPPICIDEVQYAPELFPYIKIIVDRNQNPGDFILTGSQIFSLMKGVRESLTGRLGILNLQGFSLSETLGLQNTPFLPNLETYLNRRPNKPLGVAAVFERVFNGQMPDVVVGLHKGNPSEFYSAYISTYLQKDINDITPGIDTLKFRRFLAACACRTAQILNVADIARDVQISVITANNWLNILETIGIIFYLHPYSNNLLKRTVKKPKLYFYDTGLVGYLCKWPSAETLMNGAQAGAIFETFAVSEIIKTYFNSGKEPFVYYYRNTDMQEVDLIIEQNAAIYPIEIKKALTANKSDARHFSVIKKACLPQGTGAIVMPREDFSAIDSETLLIPIGSI